MTNHDKCPECNQPMKYDELMVETQDNPCEIWSAWHCENGHIILGYFIHTCEDTAQYRIGDWY